MPHTSATSNGTRHHLLPLLSPTAVPGSSMAGSQAPQWVDGTAAANSCGLLPSHPATRRRTLSGSDEILGSAGANGLVAGSSSCDVSGNSGADAADEHTNSGASSSSSALTHDMPDSGAQLASSSKHQPDSTADHTRSTPPDTYRQSYSSDTDKSCAVPVRGAHHLTHLTYGIPARDPLDTHTSYPAAAMAGAAGTGAAVANGVADCDDASPGAAGAFGGADGDDVMFVVEDIVRQPHGVLEVLSVAPPPSPAPQLHTARHWHMGGAPASAAEADVNVYTGGHFGARSFAGSSGAGLGAGYAYSSGGGAAGGHGAGAGSPHHANIAMAHTWRARALAYFR